MHGNGLWGDIAELLSELKNVEYVDLSFNEFFGSISTNSSVITSLANTVRHLDLSHNNLSGGFLASDSVQLFRNLEVLDLGDNQITGELPSLSSMPRLRVLRLGRNQFSGSIQEELLESSVALEELDLSGNRFTGKRIKFFFVCTVHCFCSFGKNVCESLFCSNYVIIACWKFEILLSQPS